MRPDRIEPDLAPGGVVIVLYDRHGVELSRDCVSLAKAPDTEAMAIESGKMIRDHGGGSMSAYDGDTGDLMLHGPTITPTAVGREPLTMAMEDVAPALDLLRDSGEGIPWQVIGVFPTEEDGGDVHNWWDAFLYTVGLGPVELWMQLGSIEGRMIDFELGCFILNHLAYAYSMQLVYSGDSMTMALGTPDGDGGHTDQTAVWWLGDGEPAFYRQVNMSPARICIPILWSSPLGFPPAVD